MKWTKIKPFHGEIRTREFFAWFPISVITGRATDTRWLETVSICEKYNGLYHKWFKEHFVDIQ